MEQILEIVNKEKRVYVGDVGTLLIVETFVDLLKATVKKILYKKPDGTTGEWLGTVAEGDPTQIRYYLQEGDIDMAGIWKLQVYVEMPGWKGVGDVVILPVYSRIK